MGKSSGWFRRLFAGKKHKNSPVSGSSGSVSKQANNKKKSSLFGSGSAEETYAAPFKDFETRASCAEPPSGFSQMDASRRAITVAAAAAAVAEAAVAAAHAAAEVVRLTNNGRCSGGSAGRRLDVAAVIIQSAFRGYLARRALKALKALVKLQALVRGHIVRKRTADMLRRMQALARVQARARANRSRAALDSSSSHSHRRLSLPHHTRWGSNPSIKSELDANWLEQWMEECSWNNDDRKKRSDCNSSRRDDEILDKTIEVVDSWKPKTCSNAMGGKRKPTPQKQIGCQSMGRAPSSSSLPQLPFEADESSVVCSAHNSPQGSSGSCRRRSTATTTATAAAWSPRSTDCAANVSSDHPKYMAKTESSRAKVRSQSAPRLRLDLQKPRSTFRGCWDPSSSPNKSIVKAERKGSGLLNRVGSNARIRLID